MDEQEPKRRLHNRIKLTDQMFYIEYKDHHHPIQKINLILLYVWREVMENFKKVCEIRNFCLVNRQSQKVLLFAIIKHLNINL